MSKLYASSAANRRGRRPGPVLRVTALVAMITLIQLDCVAVLHGRPAVTAGWAQGRLVSKVGVIVVPMNKRQDEDARALERLMRDASARVENMAPFDFSPIAGEGVESVAAADLVAEGLRAILLRTPKRAADRLSKARELLIKMPMAGDTLLHARLAKGDALILLAEAKILEARDAVIRSLVLYPRQAVAEYESYGSQAGELCKTARESFDSSPVGDLIIKSSVKESDVWVDGVYRGETPTKIDDLAVGDHLVTVRSSGMLGQRRLVTVVAKKKQTESFELAESPFLFDLHDGRTVLMANFGQPGVVEDRIRELRNQLGIDQLIAVRAMLSKNSTQLSGYHLGTDGTLTRVEKEIVKDADYLGNLAGFVAEITKGKLLPDPRVQPLDQRQSVVVEAQARDSTAAASAYIDPNAPLFEDEKSGEKPVTSQWWFWTAIGGGAVLIGSGLALLLSGSGDQAGYATGTLKIHLHKTSGN